ncbi:hypothetical protein [Enterococcus phage vB_EfaS_IME198]|uniref:hypothetical protein n=1 Tax=Enterococcus phage vB_EfaS_IME198 TaxID=1747287 RepID=UPI00072022E6|nr:hypothetical protein AVT94_gp13 [Enterococcus phage vB_EfaS_IME198]ALO80759.1 hypothetical protein [Enterococcus phage vB_EfaS_IME198]
MFSRKYVKTLQEKNERLFEDLENAHKQIDHWKDVSARRGMEILSLKDSLEVEKEKVKYLTGVIKGLNEEARKASEESTPLTPEVICGMSTEDIQRFAEIFVEALKKESEDDSTHEYTKDTIRFSATFNGKTFLAPYPDTVANHIDKAMNLSSDGYQRVVDAFQKLSDSMYGQDTTNGFENSIHVNVFSMRLERFVIITLGLSKKAEWTII